MHMWACPRPIMKTTHRSFATCPAGSHGKQGTCVTTPANHVAATPCCCQMEMTTFTHGEAQQGWQVSSRTVIRSCIAKVRAGTGRQRMPNLWHVHGGRGREAKGEETAA